MFSSESELGISDPYNNKDNMMKNVPYAFGPAFELANRFLDPVFNGKLNDFIKADDYRYLVALVTKIAMIRIRQSYLVDEKLLMNIEEKARKLVFEEKTIENIKRIVNESVAEARNARETNLRFK